MAKEDAAVKQNNRQAMMLDMPVQKLIPKLAIPTIISMMINSLYQLVDTFFVSSLGTYASAAVGVNSSLEYIIMMAGSFLAFGANSYIARLLGANNSKKASQTLSTAFFTAMLFGLTVCILGSVFMRPLLVFLGATKNLMPYSIDYATYVLLAAPFMASNFVMNQCLRSEGSAQLSMIGIVSGAILNTILDPIFIFVFDWGVAGASAATAISKFVSFCILIQPYIRKKSILHLTIKNLSYSKDIVVEIVKMGGPSLIRLGLATVAGIAMNKMAGAFSEAALAGISVFNKIMRFLESSIMGFGQGYQPVVGFNWGAKRYDRVLSSYRFASRTIVLIVSAIGLVGLIFAPQIIGLFSSQNDAEMIRIGAFAIRFSCVAMPFHAWAVICNSTFTGLGKSLPATILALTRQGICFLPLLFILRYFFGAMGLASSQGLADILSILIALIFFIPLKKNVNELAKAQESQVQ